MTRARYGWIAGLALLLPGPARGDAGDQSASLGVSYATFSVDQSVMGKPGSVSAQGAVLVADYDRGVATSLALRGTARGGLFDGPDRTAHALGATVSLVYSYDILKYVPQ